MTKDEALKLALEALEKLARLGNGDTYGNSIGNVIAQAAITAIKAALALTSTPCEVQPEQQDEDYDALSQKQLASIKRDTRISFEDAAVRTIHKMLEPEQEPVMEYDKEELRGTFWDTTKQARAQPKQCVCREPLRLNMVHRKESPCFDYIEHPWVGLTDKEIDAALKSCNTTDTYKYFRAIEAKLKEKNT